MNYARYSKLIALLPLILAGCGTSVNLLNPDFLNEISPGQEAGLWQQQGSGSLIIYLENLTKASAHSEYASVTLRWIDGDNKSGSYSIPSIPSVSQKARLTNKNYRKTVVLSSEVTEVWIEATIHRDQIVTQQENKRWVPDNTSNLNITYTPSGTSESYVTGIFRDSSTDNASGSDFSNSIALYRGDKESIQVLSVSEAVHLVKNQNFNPGDIILFGITDKTNADNSLDLATFDVGYSYFQVSNNLLMRLDADENGTETSVTINGNANLSTTPYVEDRDNVLLHKLYQYPKAYFLIPFVLSRNTSASLSSIDEAEQILIQQMYTAQNN